MFKNGQVWKDNAGRLAFRVVFIQPVDWDEMHVQFFLNGRPDEYIYQDVCVSDFEALAMKKKWRVVA